MTPQATEAYQALNAYITEHYPNMEVQTEGKTRHGLNTLRYRKSGKSFCAFYEHEENFVLLIVLGKKANTAAKWYSMTLTQTPSMTENGSGFPLKTMHILRISKSFFPSNANPNKQKGTASCFGGCSFCVLF